MSTVARLFAVVLLTLLVAVTAAAQTPAGGDTDAARWDALASSAEAAVGDPDTPTEELEALREKLVAQRGEALRVEQERQPSVDELSKRLEALGPPPAEGVEEAPEIVRLRRELNDQLAQAQAPVLAAQEAYRRTDAIVVSIDRTVRARFSAELLTRGPSPLLPATWLAAGDDLAARISEHLAAVRALFAESSAREQLMRQLPISLLLIAGGLALAFMVRGWLVDYVEARLSENPSQRLAALLIALRNLTRLVVPAVGAGLFFAALDRVGLLLSDDPARLFALPGFIVVLIAAGWIAGSLLAPRQSAFRPLPLDDASAHVAHRLVLGLGIVLSLAYLSRALSLHWAVSTATQSAVWFPLVIFGAIGLWRVATLLDEARGAIKATHETSPAVLVRRGFRILARILRAVAVVAPLLGAAGYIPAAGFLVFRSIMTLALLGGGYVVFDLLNKIAQFALVAPTAKPRREDGGLVPVVVAAVVVLAAIPLFAIIWGARPSDIADFWTRMREGVTLGGIRISASTVLTLAVVFGIGIGIVRLLQGVLRSTVLPRTGLDAGGRNAVLAGVGYVGVAIAGLVAVAAAGLNLSSLAIVAGALSVGIGFGLQNIVSNFVSGIILLVERPVKEGDWIEVGGFSGYVRGINVRSTEIETFDRASVILPNSDLIAGTVLNRTHSGLSGRLQVQVSVTYDADPKRVEAILLAIADSHPLVLEDPAPRVLFVDLGSDSMNFELRCWLRDVNFSLSTRSDMNYEIVTRFRAEGIRIPFYGRDLPEAAPPEPPAVQLQRAGKEGEA